MKQPYDKSLDHLGMCKYDAQTHIPFKCTKKEKTQNEMINQ